MAGMTRALLALLPFLAACSSGPSTGPSPTPQPVTITGSIADTVSGAVIGQFVQSVNGLPAQVTVSQAGYVTRSTWVHSADPRVDLFPEAGFDLAFYRDFARAGGSDVLRVLTSAPSFVVQPDAVSAGMLAQLEASARAAVPAFTGGRLSVTSWATGAPQESSGRIAVEFVNDPDQSCGRARLGASAGHVWLNLAARCSPDAYMPTAIAHEIGHALGFSHVTETDALMFANPAFGRTLPSSKERHHAALAYSRVPGNTDVDVDPKVPSSFQTSVIID